MKKKILFGILTIVTMVAGTHLLVSCGNNNDTEDYSDHFQKATVELKYDYSEDLLKYCDVTITVKDFSGNTKQVDVSKAGSTSFETTSENGTLTITYKLTKKSGVEVSGDKLTLKKYLQCSGTVTTSNKYTGTGDDLNFSESLFGWNGEAVLKSPTDANVDSFISKLDADGTCTVKVVGGKMSYSEE